MSTNAEIMQTPRMVRLEWKRTFEHPNALRCLRRIAARSSRKAGYRFVSLRAISFPKVAPHVERCRLIQEVPSGGRKIPMLIDFVSLWVGRHELTLVFGTRLSSRSAADEAEEAYGPQVREAIRMSPELRRFRNVLSAPDSPFELVAVKAECGMACTTLNVMAIPRTLDWNQRDFEAGAVDGARKKAVRGTKPKVARVRLPAGPRSESCPGRRPRTAR